MATFFVFYSNVHSEVSTAQANFLCFKFLQRHLLVTCVTHEKNWNCYDLFVICSDPVQFFREKFGTDVKYQQICQFQKSALKKKILASLDSPSPICLYSKWANSVYFLTYICHKRSKWLGPYHRQNAARWHKYNFFQYIHPLKMPRYIYQMPSIDQ